MATHDKPPACGDSEFSWGEGMFPNPNLDYDRGQIQPVRARTQMDVLRERAAMLRSNVSDPNETIEALTYAKGNPGRYGGHQPLVQQSPRHFPSDGSLIEPIVTFERVDDNGNP